MTQQLHLSDVEKEKEIEIDKDKEIENKYICPEVNSGQPQPKVEIEPVAENRTKVEIEPSCSKAELKCFNYIVEQARKQSNGRSTAVEDRVVYEWAEDYYHKYEKPETAKKEKGKKPATTKKTEAPAKKVTEIKKDIQETKDDSKVSEKPEKKDAASKQQKTEKTSTKSSGLNGQMSLFDLL